MTDQVRLRQPSGRERLVAATRGLMQAVATTDVDDTELSATAAHLEHLLPGLQRRTVRHVPAPAYAEAVGADNYHSAFLNPGMVPLDVRFNDGRARATVVLDSLHEGPRNSVHGGVISHLMDTLLACLVQQQGHLCVTASLTVDYRARTPLRAPLDLAAEVLEVRSRSVRVEGTIVHEGQVTARATGLFVAVPER